MTLTKQAMAAAIAEKRHGERAAKGLKNFITTEEYTRRLATGMKYNELASVYNRTFGADVKKRK